jgi:uroporphyrinogen decarboxylase
LKEKLLYRHMKNAFEEKRRLVAPLVGFPGLNLTGCNIKLAQQNYGEHFKVVKEIAGTFKPDAIFPLMDLSVEANALGRYTVFPKEESATVVKEIFHMEELNYAEKINICYDARLSSYIETMKMMSIGLPASILRGAYVTGPYTLAALFMGADEAALSTIMNPDALHELCAFATEKIQQYVRLLIASGAQMICILEPSAVMLGPDQFEKFSVRYVRAISENCKYTDVATIYHICGNSMHLIQKMVDAGVDALSLDSPEIGIDLKKVAKKISPEIGIIGNVNPVGSLLRGTPKDVFDEVNELLELMEPYPNFILSSGCDLPQEVPTENILAFMSAGRNYKIGKKIQRQLN